MTRIQLITGTPGPEVTPEALPFPDRPHPDYRPFTFTPPHITGGGQTLAGLAAMFSTTDTAAADRAEQTWHQAAAQTAQIADELDHIAAQISDLTDGESFDQAAHTITTVAASARVFSTNAQIMGESVARLNPINSWAQAEITTAEIQLALIEEPAERALAEKAWVSSFLGGSLPVAVSGAVPPISHLMQIPVDGHGGHTTTGDRMTLGTPIPPAVTGGTGAGAGGTAGAITSAQSGGSGLVRPDQVGTSAAGAAGGGTPVVSAPGSGPGVSGAGGGVLPTVTGPAAFGGVAHPATATGAGRGSTGGIVPGGVGGTGGGRTASGASSGGAGRGVSGSVAGVRGPGGSGVGPGGVGRAGVPGGGVGPRPGGAVSPVGTGAGGQVASGGAQGAGVGRGGVAGGVPMAGTGGGRRDQKKPSSVLSQVERSGNLEKILGPAPLTVPPVIGDWARKTPPDTPQ
ncbi:hypothetical protein OS128_09040 [Corynebacterium sp. P5848]|uniref:hypothetical protein n=1 Tax=Corynebacterium marambiense TaxID=2765364 RepID=UPI00226086BB|nr:hypothetical protein [Corynebacterium marambiense]MCX7543061.1 hypothetical protein [Corynebacterium marambiense]